MTASRARSAMQRGQSTVEFVVVMLVMVPLFLIVPLLGEYLDMMQTAEQASRYVAFEGAARNTRNSWKSDVDLATEVRRRFFGNSDASVKTSDVAGDFAANRNPLWVDPTGRPLLDRFADQVGVKTQVSNQNALPLAFLRGDLGLTNDNLYNAAVTVKPVNPRGIGTPFDSLNLNITRRTVLLADAWTATSSAAIRSKIEAAPKVYPIAELRTLVNGLGNVPPVVFDPPMIVGDFDWDIVPCDRLIGGC